MESLACIRDQTAGNIEVLVLDNASTDRTPEVFAEVVGSDSRFRYLRQAEPLSALQNFFDGLDRVKTDYFMWRADDDLSSKDYILRLSAALDADAHADLAISSLERWQDDTDRKSLLPMPKFPSSDAVDRAIHLLRNKRPSWIYGVWRRDALRRNISRIGERYPYLWASDHLMMMPSVLSGRVAIEEDAIFVQRVHETTSYQLSPQERITARATYATICEELLEGVDVPPDRIGDLRAALEFHYDDRVGRVAKLRRAAFRNQLRKLLGMRPR